MSRFDKINHISQENFKRIVLKETPIKIFIKDNYIMRFYKRTERINFKEKLTYYVVLFENEVLIGNIQDARRTISFVKFCKWLRNIKVNEYKEVY